MKLFKVQLTQGGCNKGNIELQPFKVFNKRRSVIVGTIIISVLLLSGIFLYNTFAVFTKSEQINTISGNSREQSDTYFAYYIDDTATREIPKKGDGYTLDTEKSNCTNGVTVGWDNNTWTALVNYENYSATDYTRTRCNLYFKVKTSTTIADKIIELAETDTENLSTDDNSNVRYIGKDPNNYVSIDGELWRIIGVMKNIDDGTGKKETRIKLIRNESLGNFSWDTSATGINAGYGVNEWSQADLMKLLNPGYESETIGGSLYWNSKPGTCYYKNSNASRSCDFTSVGMKEQLKNLIGDAVWNTGTNGTSSYTNASNGLAKHFYEYERSTNTGKICTSGSYCTDTVARTTTWTGKIGLMNPSDYGYATGGGSTTNRATCLNTYLNNWASSSVSDCKNNDWLFNSSYQWTLMPYALSTSSFHVFYVKNTGAIVHYNAYDYITVRPAVYLLSSVEIQDGDGTSSNPYTLLKG